jgi:hypothetical protein
MRVLLLSLFFFNLSGQAQGLSRVSLSKKDINDNVKAHYQWESIFGDRAFINLRLFKNGNYEFKYTSNTVNAFSDGAWIQANGILTLQSEIQKDSLPIKVSFRPKESSDLDVKRIAFIRDLNGSIVTSAFICINNDSTACTTGDLSCRGISHSSINRIRVQYMNDGLSSQWVDIPTFDGLLQVTIQTKKNLAEFLVFDSKKYQVENNWLQPVTQ